MSEVTIDWKAALCFKGSFKAFMNVCDAITKADKTGKVIIDTVPLPERTASQLRPVPMPAPSQSVPIESYAPFVIEGHHMTVEQYIQFIVKLEKIGRELKEEGWIGTLPFGAEAIGTWPTPERDLTKLDRSTNPKNRWGFTINVRVE